MPKASENERQIIHDFLLGRNPGYRWIESRVERVVRHRGWEDKIDVDSVVQKVLMALLEEFGEKKYRGGSLDRLKAYVRNVSLNILHGAYKQWYREKVALEGMDPPLPPEDPEQRRKRREQYGKKLDAFLNLDRACRHLLLLKEAYGWSRKKIGAELGIKEATVGKRLFDCRRKLREIEKTLKRQKKR